MSTTQQLREVRPQDTFIKPGERIEIDIEGSNPGGQTTRTVGIAIGQGQQLNDFDETESDNGGPALGRSSGVPLATGSWSLRLITPEGFTPLFLGNWDVAVFVFQANTTWDFSFPPSNVEAVSIVEDAITVSPPSI